MPVRVAVSGGCGGHTVDCSSLCPRTTPSAASPRFYTCVIGVPGSQIILATGARLRVFSLTPACDRYAGDAGERATALGTVSYTHLTLPTILLV